MMSDESKPFITHHSPLIISAGEKSMFTQLTLAAALAVGAPALKEKEPLGSGPGYLGITFTNDADGIQVTDVKPDSPADRGGVKEGDVIVKLDDADLKDADTGDLVKLVAAMRPGTVVA